MKIRTITTGFNLQVPFSEDQVKKVADFTNGVKDEFVKEGYDVQTVRLATQPWEEYFTSPQQMEELVQKLEKISLASGIDYFNIGTTFHAQNIPLIYNFIKSTSTGFCTVMVADKERINYEAAQQTAQLMKKLAFIEKEGFANLRFAAIFNTEPLSPFYPAAYHRGPVSFGIGTENSDLVNKAFSLAGKMQEAEKSLKKTLEDAFLKIEKCAKKISQKENIKYNGIDVSIASSVKKEESTAYAFEKLGLGQFGQVGTLAVAKSLTDCLSRLEVKKCGYSGLMLPVLEDFGLAQRNKEKAFNLTNILLYSAVCGTGLDTIPLPGNVSSKKLYALLLDIASLAIKLDKPLSARLMPVPNKNSGDMTTFSFDYFENTEIMKI
ncbi:MAG: DUF711 family protein [Acidobacteriota bacterium]